MERFRNNGPRCSDVTGEVKFEGLELAGSTGGMETCEALRDGGPRKREGGGWRSCFGAAFGEVDIFGWFKVRMGLTHVRPPSVMTSSASRHDQGELGARWPLVIGAPHAYQMLM